MQHDYLWLQLFADGSAPAGEGEGAATGEDAGNPVQQTLEGLGVPAELAERHSKRAKQKTAAAAEPAAQQEEPAAESKPAGMSWDDFMAVPENNARMQKTMQDRLKRQGKENEEYYSKLSPALELIAQKYGIQPGENGRFDPEALAKAVQDDNSYYEDKAMELGVDNETAKHITQLEIEKRRNDAANEARQRWEAEAQAKAQRDQALRERFMSMQQQAADLQTIYPDFNLQQALQDPKFLDLTGIDRGANALTVEQAFYALYGRDAMEKQAGAIAERTKRDIANSVRAGQNHPRENGSRAAAPTRSTPSLKSMTREERMAYIKAAYPPK